MIVQERVEYWDPVVPDILYNYIALRAHSDLLSGDTSEMFDVIGGRKYINSGLTGLWGSLMFDLSTEVDRENDSWEPLYELIFFNVCHLRFVHEDFVVSLDGPACKSKYSTTWFYEHDVFYSEEDGQWSSVNYYGLYECRNSQLLEGIRLAYKRRRDPQDLSLGLRHFRYFVEAHGVFEIVARQSSLREVSGDHLMPVEI